MGRLSLQVSAFLRRGVSLILAGMMVVGSGFAAETPKGGAAVPTGALSITTDPDNAAVYVDGRLAGQTPANLASLSAGEHRVRIVKSGYLENARVVTVPAGQATRLNVKLTRTSGTSNAAGQVTSTGGGGGGGGGKKKWIIIGGAAGAATAIGVYFATKNDPPIPGTITVSPTATGMAGQTNFRISSTGASDPDKDPLTFTFNFGDGQTATATGDNASTTHTYATAGTFQVALAVSDGKHTVNAPNATVTVGPPVSGTWTGGNETFFGCGMTTNFSQNQTTLSGTLALAGGCSGTLNLASASLGGTTHPANVTWTTPTFNFTSGSSLFIGLTWTFTGATDAAGTTMSGTIRLNQASTGGSATNNTSFRRQ